MLAMFSGVLRRELVSALRRRGDILNPLWFFIIV